MIYNFVKRSFDLICSFIGILFLIPLMIIIKILFIISGDYHSIFFLQKRTGKHGKEFNVIKFRSMVYNNDINDKSVEDMYTPVGKYIRKFSLDELPQLINIFKGEMSFIGPRPWIPEYFKKMNAKQKHRLDVTPGLSGLAQVKGRNSIGVLDKINYDLEYVKNKSFLLDLKIIFLTFKQIMNTKVTCSCKTKIYDEIEELERTNKELGLFEEEIDNNDEIVVGDIIYDQV